MGDAPAWTSDPQSFSSTRWIWRKEITTITWWPHDHGDPNRAAPPTTLSEAKPAHTNRKHADWNCGCGTNNWPWRQACFVCHAPRRPDDCADTKTIDLADARHIANTIEKPEKTADGSHYAGTSANASANPEDPPPAKGK